MKKNNSLTFEEVGEILKHCKNCAKLNTKNFTCFARTVLYFKKGRDICKAREVSVKRWEEQLKWMMEYSLQKQDYVGSDIKKELNRVKKILELSLNKDIGRVYWEEIHRKDRKFGKGEKTERSVSTKQKMRDNRLVISWEERRKEEARMHRLSTKIKKKRS